MRKIIASINVTLDGFMAGPNGELDWHFPYWNEEMASYSCEQLSMMDTILLGRLTYQEMAGYWPLLDKNEGSRLDTSYAGMMNNFSKVVFSKTLHDVHWKNARLIKKDILKEVMHLKQQAGMDLIIYGSGSIVSMLMKLNLIDEYVIWVHPIALGKGNPLFKGLRKGLKLNLVNIKKFDTGVIILYYETKNLMFN